MKAAKPKKGQKRVATESDEDESSDESGPRVKKKRHTKQKHSVEVSDDDVDVIEDDVEPAEKDIEDVDVEPSVGDELQSNEQGVSTDCSL